MKTAFHAAGEVHAVDLLAAFVALWRNGETGSLSFSRGGATAGYDLLDGEIVAISSSEPQFETAAILVRAGKLDASALERLSASPGTDGALAALQAGILTRREWKWGEKIRAIEILADLLAWPDGKYIFDRDARPQRGEFALTVPRLVLELFLRSRDRNLIDHQLGPTDLPLRRSEGFEEEFATFGLTADAESVVRLIDGRASAAEISEQAPAEEFAVLKLLAALTTLGLLRPDSGLPEEEPRPRPPDVEPAAPVEASPYETWAPDLGPADSAPPAEPASLTEMRLDEPFGRPVEPEPEPSWEPSPADSSNAPGLPGDLPTVPPAHWQEATPDDQVLAEPEPTGPTPRRKTSWGLIAAALFVFLLAAVTGTVLLRSRSSREAPPIPAPNPTPADTPVPPSPVPTPLPTLTAATPIAPAAQAVASPRGARATPPPKSRPAPTAAGAPRAEEGGATRSSWLERARRDRRRLQGDKATRYAIQLELVCEPASLAEAWRHDRPGGSLWLLAEKHKEQECFRVLWGRYRSLDEARRAKAGVPAYFVTSTNRPAVVGVR